jgi:hypothetical protein
LLVDQHVVPQGVNAPVAAVGAVFTAPLFVAFSPAFALFF